MSLTCLRKGCGKEYDPSNNGDHDCQYHPGVPVFHEGLKGWSCCKKRFCDFSEFLTHPGCTYGAHTNEPPPEEADAPTDVIAELALEEVDRLSNEQKLAKASHRDGTPRSDIAVTVTKSLERAMEKLAARKATEALAEVQVGQACTNNACKGSFVDETSNTEDCVHHPGEPVFHEGYKYWSCCPQKKTYEFDEFLDMKGCTTGVHRWFKPPEAKVKECRYDWFQSDDQVSVAIFAKCIDPDTLVLKANADSLELAFEFDGTNKYSLLLNLGGRIDGSGCSASLLGTKLDIKLKKAEAGNWDGLEMTSSS